MFIPSAVMHGFTLGVAFIIAVNQVGGRSGKSRRVPAAADPPSPPLFFSAPPPQLNFILGLPPLPRHESFIANVAETLTNLAQTNFMAVAFFVVAFGGLYSLSLRYGKVPWSIVLAAAGIVIGWLQGPGGPIATIMSRYGNLQLSLVQVSPIFTSGLSIGLADWLHLFSGALSICVIAVLETLISAAIADRMTKTLFAQSQEVMAVGLANVASGLAGGIPATAALARTALNIKSGATSRAAGIVSGVSIIVLSTALFGLFKFLPLPVVAAILVNVAIKMIEWPEIIQLYHMDKPMFAVAIIVMVVCIVEDPTVGIIAGALLAQVRILFNMRDAHAQLVVYAGRTALMSQLVHLVAAKKAVAAAALKYGAEVTPDVLAALAAPRRAADDAARAASAAALLAGGARPSSDTTTLAAAAAEAAKEPAEEAAAAAAAASSSSSVSASASSLSSLSSPHAAGGARTPRARRPSAVDADIITAPPAAARDAALPVAALYAFPGYFTYVSAQVHRDRLRGLFTPTAGAAARAMPAVRIVVFSLVETYYADPDALETVGTLVEELTRAGYEVYLLGFKPLVFRAACKVHHLHEVRFFADYHALLRFLRKQVVDGVYERPPPLEPHGHGDKAHPPAAAAVAVAGAAAGAGAAAAAPHAASERQRAPLVPGAAAGDDAAWDSIAGARAPAPAHAHAAGAPPLHAYVTRQKSDIDSEWVPGSPSGGAAAPPPGVRVAWQ